MLVLSFFIYVCALSVTLYFWKHRRFYYLAWKIPRSSFDFSLKGLHDFFTADTKKMFRLMNESFYNKSDVAKTWLGPVLFVILNDVDDAKTILNSKACYDKPYIIKFAELRKGSLFGDVEYWRSHRKIMNPYFGTQGLKQIIPIFNEKTKIMMENVERHLGKKEFDIFHDMTALTLETILKVMDFDVDIQNREEKSRDIFIKNLENFATITILRIFKFWQHPEFIFKRSQLGRLQKKAQSNSAMVFNKQIMSNIRNKMNNNEQEKSANFMEALMNPKNNFTDAEIYDEVGSIILAAQDTSAIASSTTLLLLAMFKNVQQKVVDELYQVFGKTSDAPFIDFEKLNALEYLEMVINEAMRLCPVVPAVLRENEEEIILKNGLIIPTGAFVLIPIISIHRNKKYWGDDAEEFKPERFEKENFEKIHPYAFIPFTKGPRMCIGYRYAMYLMKIQLANFLMRYEVDTSLKFDELEFGMQVTMTICQGYRISIKKRCLD